MEDTIEAPERREWHTESAALVGCKSGIMRGLKREIVELVPGIIDA